MRVGGEHALGTGDSDVSAPVDAMMPVSGLRGHHIGRPCWRL